MLDITPKAFLYNQVTVDLLRTIQVIPDEYSEAILVGVGMSPSWRAWGKMSIFYVVIDGKCFCLYYLLIFPSPLFFLLRVSKDYKF